MKVKELIRQLRKMNPDAVVIFQDHDHDYDEMNGEIDCVTECESEALIERLGGPVVALS
ncbi:MAG: hypothetical protein ACK5NQ_11355 [Pseudomonas sp.]